MAQKSLMAENACLQGHFPITKYHTWKTSPSLYIYIYI